MQRKTTGDGPIHFHIGAPQYAGRADVARSVDYRGQHVVYPPTKNGTNLMAARVAEVGNIPLEKITLHEIGHLIERFLGDELSFLQTSLFEKFELGMEEIKAASPHYLGTITAVIRQQIRTLNDAKAKGVKSITIDDNKKWLINDYRNQWGKHICEEIFAEMIRVHYLEPCLIAKMPPETKPTGWEELDDLIGRLQREAEINLTIEEADVKLFPEERRRPEFKYPVGDNIQFDT